MRRRSARPCSKAGARASSRRGPRRMSTRSCSNMNGAVAAAGGDMAKAALAAGLVDQIGDRRRSKRGWRSSAASSRARWRGYKPIKLAPTSPTWSTSEPDGPIGVVTDRRHDRRRQGGPGTAGGDTIAKESRTACTQQGHQGAGRARRQPGRLGACLRTHPPGAARRQGATRSRSSCRWAASPHRAAIGSRRPPTSSTPSLRPSPARSACSGSSRASRARCRSSGIGADGVKTTPLAGEPDLLKGPSPEADQLIQTGVNAMYAPLPRPRRRSRATRRPAMSTRSPRAACGTAGPRTSSGLVDGFGGMGEAIAKAARARQARRRARRPLPRTAAELPRPVDRNAAPSEQDDDSAAPQDAFACFAGNPRLQFASALAEVRSILVGPEHPGALPRMPAGRPAPAGRARPQPVRAAEGMAVLIISPE